MSRFRVVDCDNGCLLPPSVQDWLPESHLACYVVAVVERVDLSELERVCADRGSEACHRALLLSLLGAWQRSSGATTPSRHRPFDRDRARRTSSALA